MTLLTIGHTYAYEMESLTRMFFPGEKLDVRAEGDTAAPGTITTALERLADGSVELLTRVALAEAADESRERLAVDATDHEAELAMARLLFRLLRAHTGIEPPWGILTGVRPVRLFRRFREQTGTAVQAERVFREQYLVTDEKLKIAADIDGRQHALLARARPDGFSLYISIPFCPTRCLYCSFVSHDIKGVAKLVPDYLRLLCEEIRCTAQVAARLGLRLQTVYMGGGTPTTLEADQLRTIMETVRESFDLSDLLEYTVEAGRPDTITPEKLAALREYGVERISINPQTMDDEILRAIGRGHTAAQIEEGAALARKAGFACINMDLIAGLPGDTAEGFGATLERVRAMAPENITVHTLTVKRSSNLRRQEGAYRTDESVSRMLEHAHTRLHSEGYAPYYLYRQKGTMANLENTGYALPGCEGLYNVLIMEEVQTILAVGAGAVTKLCRPGEPLQRVFNFKFPYEYIDRFPEILRRKKELAPT